MVTIVYICTKGVSPTLMTIETIYTEWKRSTCCENMLPKQSCLETTNKRLEKH